MIKTLSISVPESLQNTARPLKGWRESEKQLCERILMKTKIFKSSENFY
jgi:hypothetical protein